MTDTGTLTDSIVLGSTEWPFGFSHPTITRKYLQYGLACSLY